MLLAADIAARRGPAAEARRLLEGWYDFGVEADNDGTVEDAFALAPVAALLCDGVLKGKSTLPPRTRRQLVRTLLAGCSQRLGGPGAAGRGKGG